MRPGEARPDRPSRHKDCRDRLAAIPRQHAAADLAIERATAPIEHTHHKPWLALDVAIFDMAPSEGQ